MQRYRCNTNLDRAVVGGIVIGSTGDKIEDAIGGMNVVLAVGPDAIGWIDGLNKRRGR